MHGRRHQARRSRDRDTPGPKVARALFGIDTDQISHMNQNAIGEAWNRVRLVDGDTKAERSRRQARRHGGIAAHANDEFGAFAPKNATSGRDGPDSCDDRAHLSGRGLPRPGTRANEFDTFARGGREPRFKTEIAADEHAFAVEILSVCRKDFERRENVPRRAASRYGHAPFF